MGYFESLSEQTGISVRDLRLASLRQRGQLLTREDCAKHLRIIADTDTQMFLSERLMMRRAAELLEEDAGDGESCGECGKAVLCTCYDQ